jgi:hypothetical protein
MNTDDRPDEVVHVGNKPTKKNHGDIHTESRAGRGGIATVSSADKLDLVDRWERMIFIASVFKGRELSTVVRYIFRPGH